MTLFKHVKCKKAFEEFDDNWNPVRGKAKWHTYLLDFDKVSHLKKEMLLVCILYRCAY